MTRMISASTIQDQAKVEAVCHIRNVNPSQVRVQISDGRKVGYIVDFGRLREHCFVDQAPTPSTSIERCLKFKKNICLIPDGFKLAGLVGNTVYIAEVTYDDAGERFYQFCLLNEGEINACSTKTKSPTGAFKEIEQILYERSQASDAVGRKRRKPVSRTNGKLYVAVMYSAVQNRLKEHFKELIHEVPDYLRAKFHFWLQDEISHEESESSLSLFPVPASLEQAFFCSPDSSYSQLVDDFENFSLDGEEVEGEEEGEVEEKEETLKGRKRSIEEEEKATESNSHKKTAFDPPENKRNISTDFTAADVDVISSYFQHHEDI